MSKTRNKCMHSWLYELNITNYYIILLDLFVCLYTSCMQTWQGFIQGGGGGGVVSGPIPLPAVGVVVRPRLGGRPGISTPRKQ